MIKAIILDVDGIIIGEKIGYNSPHPHEKVINALKRVREKGIAVCLCTAKPQFSILDEIKDAHLHNPHITDAGAVIINPIDHVEVKTQNIQSLLVKDILQTLINANVYTECYTIDAYFIQKNQESEITRKHTHILQREPITLLDLVVESQGYNVTKIMPIARDSSDQLKVSGILKPFESKISMSWGVHPIANPLQFGIITALNCSKKEGAQTIVDNLGISFDEVLGVGDSTSDWNFIQLCGYGGALANSTSDLKERIKSKGEGKFFVSERSVDENGVLEILSFFNL